MDKFITFREAKDGVLQYYILQREFPHFIGKISEFPDKVLVFSFPVAGYNLWVSFGYTLRGKYIPSYPNVEKEIQQCLSDMALWFLDNRINQDKKRYAKFKIT